MNVARLINDLRAHGGSCSSLPGFPQHIRTTRTGGDVDGGGIKGEKQHQRASAQSWSSTAFVKGFPAQDRARSTWNQALFGLQEVIAQRNIRYVSPFSTDQ